MAGTRRAYIIQAVSRRVSTTWQCFLIGLNFFPFPFPRFGRINYFCCKIIQKVTVLAFSPMHSLPAKSTVVKLARRSEMSCEPLTVSRGNTPSWKLRVRPSQLVSLRWAKFSSRMAGYSTELSTHALLIVNSYMLVKG